MERTERTGLRGPARPAPVMLRRRGAAAATLTERHRARVLADAETRCGGRTTSGSRPRDRPLDSMAPADLGNRLHVAIGRTADPDN
ncbi:hypothetical protein [Streptomyces sp. NBC_01803]|uniref:hypothetical protein n=1 Tax=Streptomyces sp. NBC_01803 TaxID=2975946 RepID=UPI002DDA13A7|nr:hypothetical protein [Streptomyces sp. NBC_01803]WSA43073.1 hypothetical protein OIE51_02005 [Streptomyces sp. NBC_01803]